MTAIRFVDALQVSALAGLLFWGCCLSVSHARRWLRPVRTGEEVVADLPPRRGDHA